MFWSFVSDDQENLQKAIDVYSEKSGDSFWFRKAKLLYVDQTAQQRRLLERYGDDLVCLDATYKTSQYSLPLFFLVVKTNVDYQVSQRAILQSKQWSVVLKHFKETLATKIN